MCTGEIHRGFCRGKVMDIALFEWEHNIKMGHHEVKLGYNSIDLAQDMNTCPAVVNAVIRRQVS